MATRADRLNERLRGAQRVNVNLDESFSLDLGFDIPGVNLPNAVSPTVPSQQQASTATPPPNDLRAHDIDSSASAKDPYRLPDTSKDSIANLPTSPPVETTPHGDTQNGTAKTVSRIISSLQIGSDTPMETAAISPMDAEMITPAAGPPSSVSRIIAGLQLNSAGPEQLPINDNDVEMMTSAKRPVGGPRRRPGVTPIAGLISSPGSMSSPAQPASSPLARKSFGNRALVASKRTTKPPRRSMQEVLPEDVDELSPGPPQVVDVASSVRSIRRASGTPLRSSSIIDEEDELSPAVSNRVDAVDDDFSQVGVPADISGWQDDLANSRVGGEEPEGLDMNSDAIESPEDPEEAYEPDEPEEAEEITAEEAAKALGRKRPRESPTPASPELGSILIDDDEANPDDEVEAEAPKRKRGRPSKSPAQQRQPAVNPKSNPSFRSQAPPQPARPRAKATRKPKSSPNRRRSGDNENVAFEVTVQRLVAPNDTAAAGDDDNNDDDYAHLAAHLAASRQPETPVDVLAQLCTEVTATTLSQFRAALAASADDPAKRKEFRVKIRAAEAYRDEISGRLLQHAVQLSAWHTLRRRVRGAMREKIQLREEIMRLRGEREQVALRMDAVRGKHEVDDKEASFLLNTSTTMREIDTVVSQGQTTPELSGNAMKEAELANLELAVAQVAEKVSPMGGGDGGILGTLREFTAFLERAAQALEAR